MVKFQTCSCCGLRKHNKKFKKSSTIKSGLRQPCRTCLRELNITTYRLSNWSKDTIYKHRIKGQKLFFSVRELKELAARSKECAYCGAGLKWNPEDEKPYSQVPTLERLDNHEETRIEDVLIVCHKCNATKRDRSLTQFVDYMRRVLPKIKSIIKKRKRRQS